MALILASSGTLPGTVDVSDFLPRGFVKDGTISYQEQIQAAIDSLPDSGGTLAFPPMTYLIDNPAGLRLRSNLSLLLTGSEFRFSPDCREDGQMFGGHNATDLSILGGSIIGRNDAWPDGVNIRGIHLTGTCSRIRIEGMQIRDLSSNGIGIFGEGSEHPATDIHIVETVIRNSSNRYNDYQVSPPMKPGPETGSLREDQGLIAMYHVHGFRVRDCRLTDSRSDGTHFYSCRNGLIKDNQIERSKMGGYFLESCRDIQASSNLIHDNGSRGVTIERGSESCTLIGNSIRNSGREGLWIPDSSRCIVSGNIFALNGRKPNGALPHQIWNANITINQVRFDPLQTPTSEYLIMGNLIETDENQIAAIRVDTSENTADILIQSNQLVGPNRTIMIEGSGPGAVTLDRNFGGRIVRADEIPNE